MRLLVQLHLASLLSMSLQSFRIPLLELSSLQLHHHAAVPVTWLTQGTAKGTKNMMEFLLMLCDTWDNSTRPMCHDISRTNAN